MGTPTGGLYGADTWPVGQVLWQGLFEQIWCGHNMAAWEGFEQHRGDQLLSTHPVGAHSLGKKVFSSADQTVVLPAVSKTLGKRMPALRFSIKVSKQQLVDSQPGKKTKVKKVQPWTMVPDLS